MIAVGDRFFGRAPELLVRASDAFGGGIGGCHEEVCGVLSGGALVLGALKGRLSPSENDEALYALLRAFREQFIAMAGHSLCNPVRNRLPEQDKRCAPIVAEGTRILLELCAREGCEPRR
ncbi:MAG: C-GCAxxG-C-C family protein [Anaerolineae bacterium]